jgi:hypothetical protein
MDFYNTVAGFFQPGGLFMYPIMAVLVIGMAIERYIYLSQEKARNLQLWNKLMPLLEGREVLAGGGGYRKFINSHQPHLQLWTQPRAHITMA